jgi:Vacuolar protein sorting-associated protein
MIGLFTRPTAGVIDFASGSFNAVRRVADTTEETKRSRAPRLMSPDGITRPYSALEAEGNAILHELDKGRFVVMYWVMICWPVAYIRSGAPRLMSPLSGWDNEAILLPVFRRVRHF